MWGQMQDHSKPAVQLDRDNTWGNGDPETTTFFRLEECEYDCKWVFRVWDYCSLSQALEHESEAVVRLYNADGLHSTYHVGAQGLVNFEDYGRTSPLTGDNMYKNRWDVFQLDATGGTVVVEDCSSGNCADDETNQETNHGSCIDWASMGQSTNED